MNREEKSRKIMKIIAKAWADENFKKKLVENPLETLREQGIEMPPNVKVRVVEDTADLQYFTIPYKPEDVEIVDQLGHIMWVCRASSWDGVI